MPIKISAQEVKELRLKTGAGMMDCNHFYSANEWLFYATRFRIKRQHFHFVCECICDDIAGSTFSIYCFFFVYQNSLTKINCIKNEGHDEKKVVNCREAFHCQVVKNSRFHLTDVLTHSCHMPDNFKLK